MPDEGSDAADADAHSSDEDPALVLSEVLGDEALYMIDLRHPCSLMCGEEARLGIGSEDRLCRLDALRRDGEDSKVCH